MYLILFHNEYISKNKYIGRKFYKDRLLQTHTPMITGQLIGMQSATFLPYRLYSYKRYKDITRIRKPNTHAPRVRYNATKIRGVVWEPIGFNERVIRILKRREISIVPWRQININK